MTADLARAAIGYARRGLPVLPLWWTDDNSERCSCGGAPRKCRPGKHPVGDLVHHGVTDATLDQRTIANWWRRYPPANVAIATGRDFRLLVVDIDPDAGGEASLAVLEREHGALPASVAVVTPRGGRHLYLIVPAGRPLPTISAGKLGPGLDHRCQGGYVAAPPSAIFGKPYTWAVDSADRFAEAPGWLLDLLARGGGNGQATRPRSGSRWSPAASTKAPATTPSRASLDCCSGACPSRSSRPSWSPVSTLRSAARRSRPRS